VKLRRIFAGCIVLLLLSASSLAIACELSCGFGGAQQDCHSSQAASDELMPSGMAMDGMAMPGMGDDNLANREIVLSQNHSIIRHAVLADMGACERQSCDQQQTIASKATHVSAAQFDTILGVSGTPRVDNPLVFFHDARDGLISTSPPPQTSLSLNLRI
jgi:hypothetical protein